MADDTQPTDSAPVMGEDAAEMSLVLPEDPAAARDLLVEELAIARRDTRTILEDLQQVTADFDDFRSKAVPQDEAQEYLDDLRRVAADFENFRKRTQREMAENIERASQRVVMGLLPVLDSFDLAVAHEPATDNEANLLGGVNSTREQLLDALNREGLEVIASVGEAFDPEVHEAVTMEGTPEHPVVVGELRRGYMLRGRVLRAALVAVGEDAPEGDDG
ncbi:MAG: nucleotide exchange factor GrpE [Acidimicrobiia bacterium]|nr:nucleotide exchange factor GrpE [Acidimicrobiia bacterium]